MARIYLAILVVPVLVGCAIAVVPGISGGSKSDGIVAFAYEYTQFRRPEIDSVATDKSATLRCEAWGYESAVRFGGSAAECTIPNDTFGCTRWRVTFEYQCAGPSK